MKKTTTVIIKYNYDKCGNLESKEITKTEIDVHADPLPTVCLECRNLGGNFWYNRPYLPTGDVQVGAKPMCNGTVEVLP